MEDIEAYLSQLTVVKLRDELKKRHVGYVGKKHELIARLQEIMLKERKGDEPEEQTEQESTDETKVGS